MNEPWRTCESCQRAIPDGERYITLCLYEESCTNRCAEVYDAESIFYWCPECAAKLDFDGTTVPLKTEANDQEKK